MSDVRITVSLPAGAVRRLAVLTDEGDVVGRVASVLQTLADHAQQGVYRPGAWERDWLIQVFGDEWLDRIDRPSS